MRVGSSNRQADAQLIAEMQRFAIGETFDEWPMPEVNSEAVDFRLASESFAPVRKLRRRHLETLRLLTLHQGRRVPTIGGMLLFRISIFDDRLEVENPGVLPFGLTLEDLPLGVSKLRNRVLGRVFQELGLVEQWGSGVQRMIAACRDEGLAAPVWEVGTSPNDPKRKYLLAHD